MRKYLLATLLLVFILAAPAIVQSMTTQCPSFTFEQGCKNAGCIWCSKCSGATDAQSASSSFGTNYYLGNNYGADRCVDTNLECTYSCSKACGANCTANSDCPANLTDTECSYDGYCSACACAYKKAPCPKPGRILSQPTGERFCYYGNRVCGSSGCFVDSCQLREGEICEPDKGCIEGSSLGEYLTDYRCSGDSLLAKKVIYICNATECLFNKTDTFVQQCKNGCFNNACRDELCNIAGVMKDCNEFDGYYGGRYCRGQDVYQTYRDYRCSSNECVFTAKETRQLSCGSCVNGVCAENKTETVIYINEPDRTGKTFGPANPALTTPLVTHPGNRLYNGLFFGRNSITLNAKDSGYVNFTVTKTNRLGSLLVRSGGRTLFTTKQTGSYSVPFANATGITLSATSSGAVFFMPAAYDVRNIVVVYAK